jgi:hypothetical protein
VALDTGDIMVGEREPCGAVFYPPATEPLKESTAMAAGRLPVPGSEFGPCPEPCQHIDCAATREDAAQVCRICDKPIGYEVRFYQSAGQLVHAACLEEEIAGRSPHNVE